MSTATHPVDELLPAPKLFTLGLQHVLVMYAGAIAVPLNYRYTEEEIKYCLDLAECDVLIFGPEFTGRIETIGERIPNVKIRLFLGQNCPVFA